MKHGRDCPSPTCSQCRQASGEPVAVRRIDQDAGFVLVDGVPTRPIDSATDAARSYYGKRGGKALHATKGKR